MQALPCALARKIGDDSILQGWAAESIQYTDTSRVQSDHKHASIIDLSNNTAPLNRNCSVMASSATVNLSSSQQRAHNFFQEILWNNPELTASSDLRAPRQSAKGPDKKQELSRMHRTNGSKPVDPRISEDRASTDPNTRTKDDVPAWNVSIRNINSGRRKTLQVSVVLHSKHCVWSSGLWQPYDSVTEL